MTVTVITNNGGRVEFSSMEAAQRYCRTYGGYVSGCSYNHKYSEPSIKNPIKQNGIVYGWSR